MQEKLACIEDFLYSSSVVIWWPMVACRIPGDRVAKTARSQAGENTPISWEGDSKEILSAWDSGIKLDFGFSLREMQEGRSPRLINKPMESIGPKVFELVDYDDKKDYRLIYVARIDDVIYVLHCFEKTSQKTKKRDLNIAKARLKAVQKRLREEQKMPSSKNENKPHVTKGDIFDDLGLSPKEALHAKIKHEIWRDLVEYIERRDFSQAELAKVLKIHQPDVSNLLRGKISKFSTDKLFCYAGRLNLGVHVKLKEPKVSKGIVSSASATKSAKKRELAHA
jgi:phage-related protein/predicted XRE-type DNA-binding protein